MLVPTNPPKPRLRWVVILVTLAAVLVTLIVIARGRPLLTASGCQARTSAGAIPLDTEQAAIAATIAGVAHHRRMPARAVVVAYTAAMQESKLHNLPYGDRDSVGVFQQRPSEGWGPAAKLLDPVYASTRFFAALASVHGYRHQPVYEAAQAVQHSADGTAYMQYQVVAANLAAAFTGHRPHAVWCWAPDPGQGRPNVAAVRRALADTFGAVGSHRVASPGTTQAMLVKAPYPVLGWAVAAWLVTHATSYGIHDVRYAGFIWQASTGNRGWTRDRHPTRPGEIQAS